MKKQITYEIIRGSYDREFHDFWKKYPYKGIKYASCESIFVSCGFHGGKSVEYIFFVARTDKMTVGIAKLKLGGFDSCYYPGFCNWISFVSVREGYEGLGIASNLIEMLFQHDMDHVIASGYSTRGYHFLRKKVIAAASLAGVRLFEEDEVHFPTNEDVRVDYHPYWITKEMAEEQAA